MMAGKEKVTKYDSVILLSKHCSFLAKPRGKINTQYGEIDLGKIKHYGQKIKSKNGYVFHVTKPTIIDFLRKCKRGPQIIMPKDAASIISITGLGPGWHCLDAGAGSGFLSLFLASLVGEAGKVTTYEIKDTPFNLVKRNIKLCGFNNIKIKKKDVKSFSEKNLDLIVFDMKGAERLIQKAYKALKPGGWLVIYSPQIEQQQAARAKLEKNFISVQTIENIQREWQVSDFTHPHPSGILHSGFLTFARKV